MPKLTKNFINTKVVRPDNEKVLFYRDDEVKGFGLKVTRGSMTFIAEGRVNGSTRRVTLGKFGVLTPEEARQQARVILSRMAAGFDPRIDKMRSKTTAVTLSQAFEEYMSSKEFRRNTILSFNRVMLQNLKDWQSKPVTSITRQMVEDRFKELSSGSKLGTSGKANANLTMQVLRATLNYISLKYEVEMESLCLRQIR